jgi:hypothetical protein
LFEFVSQFFFLGLNTIDPLQFSPGS